MAEDQESSAERTEEPTPKRLDEALKKGNIAFSREVNSFILMVFFSIFVFWVLPGMTKGAVHDLSNYITSPHDIIFEGQKNQPINIAITALKEFAYLAYIPLLIAMIAGIFGSFIQNGFIIASEALNFDLSKISVFKGIERIFSMRSIVEFIKGIFKITLIGVILYFVVKDDAMHAIFYHDYEVEHIMALLFKLIKNMLISLCVILGFIAAIDFAYQKYDHFSKLKMSRQEIKEEMRQTEGDPEIKSKLRALRLEKAKRRMMKAAASATVVITNPEHYSVALLYKPGEMEAPIVVAKGIDEIALKIREVARNNRIPIVRNPPLARALYAACDLDEVIPYQQYKAVAEIITKILMVDRAASI
jgi:flagellar biosynthetic protein FlhB